MDTVQLRQAHDRFLEAATRVAKAGGTDFAPPTGEWNFEQILAHVALVDRTINWSSTNPPRSNNSFQAPPRTNFPDTPSRSWTSYLDVDERTTTLTPAPRPHITAHNNTPRTVTRPLDSGLVS